MPQQGMIPQQQGPAQPQQGQGQTYPANAEEVGQFVNDIMRMLYTEGQPEKIMQNLTTGGNLPQKLGQTAGIVVMSVLERRKQQSGGRKPHLKLVVMGLKKTLEELGEMMEMAGLPKPTPEIMQEASQYAGQIVESAISPQQQQGQQPQQQGQPMQAPQQQGGM